METLNFFYEWYKWILGIPFLAGFAGFIWKYRVVIKENAMFFWNFKKRFEKLEENVNKHPISKNARFCPNCDARMKLQSVYGTGNWFKCEPCDISQWYETIHK